MMNPPLHQHRSHDYRYLIRCWQALVKEAGLKMSVLLRVADQPVYVVTSPDRRNDDRPVIYISAGVHGDEAAAPWGLLEWARANVPLLKQQRVLLFPALNPHGLILNTRADYRGMDINRSFHLEDDPLISAWLATVKTRRFAICICLHEDYDGQGCYVYELSSKLPSMGAALLADCASIIPPDTRAKIEGRAARHGVIARRVPPELPGQPEAIVLHYLGAPISFTFESPSEYSLADRVAVQQRFVESAIHHVLGL